MGLDMYLRKKTHIWRQKDKDKIKIEGLPPKVKINTANIESITEEVAYWRKSNAIHNWFVQNIQQGKDDCGEYRLTSDNLRVLLRTINEVLEDRGLARKTLPTVEGFFFGSAQYDDDYFSDLKNTQKVLVKILKEQPEDGIDISYIYQSSW